MHLRKLAMTLLEVNNIMNNFESDFRSFQGKLLVPINYHPGSTETVELVPPEGYMYIIATVDKDVVAFMDAGFSISKEEIIEVVKASKGLDKLPFIVILAKILQAYPNLYIKCKLNRLGYDHSKYKKMKSLNTNPKLERRRERAFIIKVLKKKKDWKNLAKFTSLNKASKSNNK